MMSASQVNRLADQATQRAKRAKLKPVKFGKGKIPFLGDYVPDGFQRIKAPGEESGVGCVEGYLLVDGSGWGTEGELAMTQAAFERYAAKYPDLYFGIAEAGQFQVVVAAFVTYNDYPKYMPFKLETQ